MMEQELVTASSSGKSLELETKRENYYDSPDGLDETFCAAETKIVNAINKRIRAENKHERIVIGIEKRNKLAVVDLSAFKEYNELVKKYSDLAIASKYKAEAGETGYLVEGCKGITAKVIKRACEMAQGKVQSDYKNSMFTVKQDGATFLPNLVDFRLTPAKKVFLSLNIPQLKFIAHKKAVARGQIPDKDSPPDLMEKYRQFFIIENSAESYAVDIEYRQVHSAVLSAFQSEFFGVSGNQFKHDAGYDNFAILRIIQPYDKMEDFLGPLLWSLESAGVKILAKTPIFNEGIACNGEEFNSALVLISTSKWSVKLPRCSNSFPHTEIDVVAHSVKCQACVEGLQSSSRECFTLSANQCPHVEN